MIKSSTMIVGVFLCLYSFITGSLWAGILGNVFIVLHVLSWVQAPVKHDIVVRKNKAPRLICRKCRRTESEKNKEEFSKQACPMK